MYEALYRKYRPKTFDDVVGQEYITETLKTQVRTGRLSHAYLFIGTRGTGKTTCARILAKAVNCEHPVDGNPCNACPSCLGIEDGSILDVVEMDAASNNGVEDVRLLRDEAIFSPATVRKRVYIIDEVHMLSKPAFNALLKILEEPPSHLMFILATTELQKVLPTILSRCQRHSFRRLDPDTIAGRLLYVAEKEGIRLEPDAAQLLGRLAEGGMRDGLSLLDQCNSSRVVDTETVLHAMGLAGSLRIRRLADAICRRDASEALEQFGSLWQDGKDPSALLGELAGFFRDSLFLRLAPKGGAALVSGAFQDDDLRSVSLSDQGMLWILNTIQKYVAAIASAGNPRLQGELCMIELCGVDGAPVRSAPSAETVPVKRTEPVPTSVRPAPPPAPAAPPMEPPEESKEPETRPGEEEPGTSVPAASAAGDVTWEEILAAMQTELPAGTFFLLKDSSQAVGVVTGNALILRLQGFLSTAVNTPETINRFRQTASRLAGRPMEVRLEPFAGNSEKKSSLDDLSRFGNVTIQ